MEDEFMKNAITMSIRHQWRGCSSFRELAHVLLHEVHLEGRMIQAHGRVALDATLFHPEGEPADDGGSDVTWMLIDEGLLLVRWRFDLWKGGYRRDYPFTLWIPDIENDRPPLVESCLQAIARAEVGRVTEGYEKKAVKQDVNLRVDSILLLQDDLSLYAFPLEDFPKEHLLGDDESEKLHALGIRFTEPEYSGYLDLRHCDLFVQGPDWRYSRFPWLKREPRLATGEYAYMVLVAGEERSALACDGSENRECLFCEQFAGPEIDVIHLLVFRAAETGDWPYEAWFNPREIWERAMEDWKVFLAHDDWEGLFETLCKPDYGLHTVDTSWLYLINDCYRSDYSLMKEALQYVYDWVEQVLETEEGVTAYCIW
jgi:hypothetical protein